MRELQARFPGVVRNAPVILMGLAAVASVILLLILQSGLTFFQDEWNMVIHRTGFNADAFFDPNDVHPVPLVVAIYKVSLELFGLSTVGPERVLSVLLYALTGILLFAYVRRLVGDWLALFPAVILLFLGPGENVLLWPFEMTLVGSLAAGLGTLLALERDDRLGDVIAAVLLVVAMACSSLGVSFALAAGVDVLLKRRRRGLLRLWVPAISIALYGLWYLTYGHEVPSAISFANAADVPLYAAEGISTSIASLVGLNAGPEAGPGWAPALLVALVVLVAFWLVRRGRVSDRILVVGAAALSFWVLSGLNFIPGREPTASRYQYIGVVFLVLFLAEIFRGYRPPPRVVAIGAALTAVALLSNLGPLKDGLAATEQQSELARGELAAIEIARDSVAPDFVLGPDIAGTASLVPIDAASYLSAVREHGSPAASPEGIFELEASVRRQVDIVLAAALSVSIDPNAGSAEAGSSGPAPVTIPDQPGVSPVAGEESCLRIEPGAAAAGLPMTLTGATAIHLDSGGPGELGIWRFAAEPAFTNQIKAGRTSLLEIPPDRAEVPWQSILTAAQGATVCSHSSGAADAG